MRFNKIILLGFLLSSILLFSCDQDKRRNNTSSYFLSPETGAVLKVGDSLTLKLDFANGALDSVQYFIDNQQLNVTKDTATLNVSTKNLHLGSRLITAKIYRHGAIEEVNSNIILMSAVAPASYTYKIINTYPHASNSYVQGLEFHNGVFYESAGTYGGSSLRKVNLDGKVLQQKDIDKRYFTEGLTVVGDKIIQLTYREKVGFEYDKNTFELLKTFPYNHASEGWGLTFDGETIYNTDGTNTIHKLDKKTYLPTGSIEVYDDKGAVDSLNELEWIDGKIYANIYTSELIAIINPQSGAVEAYINMMGLPHGKLDDPQEDVLNGIAYDKVGKRLFVTGKRWDKLFQIEVIKK